MFTSAMKFNHNLGSWDVSRVVQMGMMFTSARIFNQALGNWDVAKVTDTR